MLKIVYQAVGPIPKILYELKDNYNISTALKFQFSYCQLDNTIITTIK